MLPALTFKFNGSTIRSANFIIHTLHACMTCITAILQVVWCYSYFSFELAGVRRCLLMPLPVVVLIAAVVAEFVEVVLGVVRVPTHMQHARHAVQRQKVGC